MSTRKAVNERSPGQDQTEETRNATSGQQSEEAEASQLDLANDYFSDMESTNEHLSDSESLPSSGVWSSQDDQLLLTARSQGLTWAQISQHFQSKTPKACRRRHKEIMEQTRAVERRRGEMHKLAKEYMRMRKEIWSDLATRLGEDWTVVEEKCMSNGLENLQSNAEVVEHHEHLSGDHHGSSIEASSIPPASKARSLSHMRLILSWINKISRPKLKPGYRRIEWTCDCGVDLYGDFAEEDGSDLDALQLSLDTPAESINSSSDSEQWEDAQPSLHQPIPSSSSSSRTTSSRANSTRASLSTGSTDASSVDVDIISPKFLALCVNTGGMYKTLAELDMSRIHSDGEAFSQIQKAYLQYRGVRSRLHFLVKPVTVEFVRFTLWNLRHGYVSVCDRPNSLPPNTCIDYEFIRPPMPPEVFVHYLEHGDGDLSPNRLTWLPRLPKRLNNKVMDGGEATEGWGIHVIEGPNRAVVFWIVMVTISASMLASVIWTMVKGDIGAGMGLGAFIVALPPAIMGAFLFRLGAE